MNSGPISLTFDNNEVEIDTQYKYVGNIIKSITRYGSDIFSNNYEYLCNQSVKAQFGLKAKLKVIGDIQPTVMVHLFESLIKPILIYGSDVWGASKPARTAVDTIFLRYVKNFLGVKTTTSTHIVHGEVGCLPPSTACVISVLRYANRVSHMHENTIAKKVYCEFLRLHDLGFNNWYSDIFHLANIYNLNITEDCVTFRTNCYRAVTECFINDWKTNLNDLDKNPILRLYKDIKCNFELEPYLELVKEKKYRRAIAQIRCSSHVLQIERGRHTRPKTPREQRLCNTCGLVEDEYHFVINCPENDLHRNILFTKIAQVDNAFYQLHDNDKFLYLINSKQRTVLTWFGKFLHNAFKGKELSSYPNFPL